MMVTGLIWVCFGDIQEQTVLFTPLNKAIHLVSTFYVLTLSILHFVC